MYLPVLPTLQLGSTHTLTVLPSLFLPLRTQHESKAPTPRSPHWRQTAGLVLPRGLGVQPRLASLSTGQQSPRDAPAKELTTLGANIRLNSAGLWVMKTCLVLPLSPLTSNRQGHKLPPSGQASLTRCTCAPARQHCVCAPWGATALRHVPIVPIGRPAFGTGVPHVTGPPSCPGFLRKPAFPPRHTCH